MTLKAMIYVCAGVVCAASSIGTSHASVSITGMGHWGSFAGTLDYSYTSPTAAQLAVSLTNTSPAHNGGYLTAFAFNNPFGQVAGVSLSSSLQGFNTFGNASWDNGINSAPYGLFDIGAGLGGNFQGGGKPSPGLAAGHTADFIFHFSGTGLDQLNVFSFLETMSVPPGAGEGPQSFLARFRGFDNGESDKVPGLTPGDVPTHVIPEPASIGLLLSGLFGFFGFKKARA